MYNEAYFEFWICVFGLTVGCYCLSTMLSLRKELRDTKHKFLFYSLRDRLAYQVIAGSLPEKSLEYDGLINVINYHIHSYDDINLATRLNLRRQAAKGLVKTSGQVDIRKYPEIGIITEELLYNTKVVIVRNSWLSILLGSIVVKLRYFYMQRRKNRENFSWIHKSQLRRVYSGFERDNTLKQEIERRLEEYSYSKAA